MDKCVFVQFCVLNMLKPFLDDKNDAFWLAQIYYSMHQYSRAERLLTRPFPVDEDEDVSMVNGQSQPGFLDMNPMNILDRGYDNDKGKNKDPGFSRQPLAPDLFIPGLDTAPHLRMLRAPEFDSDDTEGTLTLVDMSVACRYLAAQCQIRQGKWPEASEMLGEANPFRGADGVGPRIRNTDGGIKVHLTELPRLSHTDL